MDILSTFAASGIVPVVVLNDVNDAVPTAKALLAGGIRVMEITFRTTAAANAIKVVAEQVPDIVVGAGTVVTLDQCKKALECGARFIVMPGYDEEIVSYCCDHGVTVTPGCVTPTEIMMALKHGLKVLKFFPANVYGGLTAMKSLSGPFVGLKFVPTGGVNTANIADYATAPYVHAVGGSWICPAKDISDGNFEKITELCKEARKAALGYELAHIGINMPDADASEGLCDELGNAFDFSKKLGNSSNFSGAGIEVLKEMYLGEKGHIAIRTNNIEMAMADLVQKGFNLDENTKKFKGDKLIAVYLEQEFGGFAIHLLQK